MRLKTVLASTISGIVLAACAPATRATTTSNEPVIPGWSGSLQPTQQRTGNVAVTGQTKAFGNVTVTPAAGSLDRMHIALSVAVPTTGAQSMQWAVLSGRCGSGDLAIGSWDMYPLIDISSNGRGQIESDLPLTMEASGTYHVNVYSGGRQLENVVTCANLRFTGTPSR